MDRGQIAASGRDVMDGCIIFLTLDGIHTLPVHTFPQLLIGCLITRDVKCRINENNVFSNIFIELIKK